MAQLGHDTGDGEGVGWAAGAAAPDSSPLAKAQPSMAKAAARRQRTIGITPAAPCRPNGDVSSVVSPSMTGAMPAHDSRPGSPTRPPRRRRGPADARVAALAASVLLVGILGASATLRSAEAQGPVAPSHAFLPLAMRRSSPWLAPTATLTLVAIPTIGRRATPSPPATTTPATGAPPSPTPGPTTITDRRPLFQSGGAPYAVAARGRYAYLGVGPRIQVVALADVARPVVVAETSVLGGVVEAIVLDPDSSLAFVAATTGGTHILDLTEPALPRVLASMPPDASSFDVVSSGDTLYVADGTAGLAVWDITDPALPVRGARVALPGVALAVAVSGSLLVVAGGDAGMHVLDAQTSATPQLVATYEPDPQSGIPIVDVAAAGLQAFALDDIPRLFTVDLTNLRAPITFPGFTLVRSGCCGREIVVEDGILYMLWAREVVALRPRAGRPPEVLARSDEHYGHTDALGVFDGRVLLAGFRGLAVVDLSFSPPGETDLGELGIERGSARIVLSGSRLYRGNTIYDISDPAVPRRFPVANPEIGTVLAAARSLAITAGMGSERTGAHLYQITDPSQPRLVADFNPDVVAGGAAIGSGFAVVGGWAGGGCPALEVFDITDPARPVTLASLRLPELRRTPASFAISGPYAFVGLAAQECDLIGALPAGLLVLDLAHPPQGAVTPQLELNFDIHGVAVRGDYLYLAAVDFSGRGYGALLVVDVSRPMEPKLVGRWSPPGWIRSVAADEAGVYVSFVAPFEFERWGGVAALDVSDPTRPVERRRFSTGSVGGLAVEDGVLWVASEETGLWAWSVADQPASR